MKNLTVIIAVLMSLNSCSIKKSSIDVNSQNLNEIIRSCIDNYIESSFHRYQKSSVYTINISTEGKIQIVNIAPASITYEVENSNLTSSELEGLPNSYFVQDDALFLWWDSKVKTNNIDVNVLFKYQYLTINDSVFTITPKISLDEKINVTKYIFCKNNLNKNFIVRSNKIRRFRRVIEKFDCKP